MHLEEKPTLIMRIHIEQDLSTQTWQTPNIYSVNGSNKMGETATYSYNYLLRREGPVLEPAFVLLIGLNLEVKVLCAKVKRLQRRL